MRTSLLNSKCTANVGRKMAPFKALPLKVVPAGLAACGRDLPPSDTIRQSTLDIANENKGVGVLWGFTAPLEALQHTRISQHRVLAPAGEPKEGCVCAVLLWEAALGFSSGLWVLRAKTKAASPGLTLWPRSSWCGLPGGSSSSRGCQHLPRRVALPSAL